MHTTRLGGVTTGAALLLLAFVSPATATPVAQGPATPTATPGPPSAMPAGPPAPTLTSDDLPPGYDELFLSLADVPMGPIVGQMLLDSFLRRAPGLGPELILSTGVRAPEFASLPTLPSAQRAMHDATADSWLRAADSLAVIRDSFVAGRARQAETLRSAREAVEPPGLAPGAWMVMDHY